LKRQKFPNPSVYEDQTESVIDLHVKKVKLNNSNEIKDETKAIKIELEDRNLNEAMEIEVSQENLFSQQG